MIMDFTQFNSEQGDKNLLHDQLEQFIQELRSSQSEIDVMVNLHTCAGSKLVGMKILQIIGDTLYLTDEFESMVITDFSHVKFIELVD